VAIREALEFRGVLMLVELSDDGRADEKDNILIGKQLIPADLL
jgi:hypothetical protein